ncbi:MAG: phosphate signaling complex protein PhoU [Acidimicrobiia bacterium]|nr:phosphate signaling complex protein PhoU [Acidimicrobiia bacterium]
MEPSGDPMTDTRSHFHKSLEQLERDLIDVADRAEQMVGMAVESFCNLDMDLAQRVVDLDDAIDETFLVTREKWLQLMARQQPMGGDLRTMAVLLQTAITLERTGDQAVNIAKMAQAASGLPPVELMVNQINEMGDLVRNMIRAGIDSFVRRDIDEARLLPAMDEPVDRLNRDMYRQVVEAGPDRDRLEFATKGLMVSRALERVGDQVVDIAEHVAFLITGEMGEFDESGI